MRYGSNFTRKRHDDRGGPSRAIQHSQESLRVPATRYGGNPKTVFKWRKRSSVADLPTGPRDPKSSVLSVEEEAIIVAFRRHTLLPLDDCRRPYPV
jgi:transposase-like protein